MRSSGFASRVKGILVVEINAGQMIEDVRLACHDSVPVYHYGRLGGIVPQSAGGCRRVLQLFSRGQ